jgi:hypothetical protein
MVHSVRVVVCVCAAGQLYPWLVLEGSYEVEQMLPISIDLMTGACDGHESISHPDIEATIVVGLQVGPLLQLYEHDGRLTDYVVPEDCGIDPLAVVGDLDLQPDEDILRKLTKLECVA